MNIAHIQQRYELLSLVNVKESPYSAKGDGVADDSSAFISAIANAGNKILYIPPGTYKLSNNVTAGATVEVWFSNGVTLSVDNTKTFTISGKLTSPYIPTNSGAGTFTYSSASVPPYGTVNNFLADATPNTDHSVSGATIFPMKAHENMAFGDICYINSDGECAIADADAEVTARVFFVCASESISADATGDFAYIPNGFIIRDDTWNWGTKGAWVYLSTTGTTGNTWTTTAPSGTDDAVIPLGIVLTANVIAVGHLIIVERT